MYIKIYQISIDRDKDSVAFMRLGRLQERTISGKPDEAIYDLVHECESQTEDLEAVFRNFNFANNNKPPKGYAGRSMSVSDVIEVTGAKAIEDGLYYVDTIGFKKVEWE